MTALRIMHSEAATSFGGQEQYIFQMMNAMRDQGHHLEAICQPHAILAQRLREAGFTVHTMLMDGPANFLKGALAVRKILRQGRFDILNTHSRRDTVLAGCGARLAGTRLIVRTRHLAKPPGSLLSYTWIPHCVTTPSNFVRDGLIKRGVAPARVATVYPVVELAEWRGASTLRAELGLDDADIVVGCVAVMRARKGHRFLIEAIQPLMQSRSRLHLVMAGGGSPVFEQIQRQVVQMGLQDRVHLLGPRTDIPNVLAGFDLFALATEQEASGTVFVEAAGAGLAVIGTDIDGVPEMMENGVSGLLAPLGDKAAWTAALEQLIDDPALRVRMGREGYRMVRHDGKFSRQAMVERIESCYLRWLNERK